MDKTGGVILNETNISLIPSAKKSEKGVYPLQLELCTNGISIDPHTTHDQDVPYKSGVGSKCTGAANPKHIGARGKERPPCQHGKETC